MNPAIVSALQITLAGMALVMLAILALWLVMVALVRWTGEKKESANVGEVELAAAAGVALALAEQAERKELHEFPQPPTAIVSAWQSVMRGKMLDKRGTVK